MFMKRFFSLLPLSIVLAMPAWANSAASTAAKRPFDPAPSADLAYAVKAKQGDFMLDGSNTLKWQVANNKYDIKTETRAMILGKILSASSEGGIDDHGLAPEIFNEKRVRRDAAITTFDRSARAIRFTASKETYPMSGGEQDRTSIVWQLISHARAAPKKFAPGSEWQYFVAGPNDAETWTFKVGQTEKIETPFGQLQAVHVTRLLATPKSQQLELWLAPSLEWYPVRLRQTEQNGDYIEQNLEQVSKK